ncbi:MAG: NUDIX hydrolase [Thermodesulfovibrio sp.]|nr:NUDIX hydrolase [Thermodesulfovibrio sp.]
MKRAFSAGGVVYKFEEGKLKILLIATKSGKVWSLPKGIIEKEESPKEAALREIKEETGVDGEIIDEVGEVSYWFIYENEKYFKKVKYFLVKYKGGEINPDWEVDTAQWFSPQESLEKLTYKSDREILKKALEKINE